MIVGIDIVRMREIEESVKILRQAIAQIPDGDVHESRPKKLDLPKDMFIQDMNLLEVM